MRKILLFLFVLLFHFSAYGQPDTEISTKYLHYLVQSFNSSVITEDIPGFQEVVIYNSTSQKLNFNLSYDEKNWGTYFLNEKASQGYLLHVTLDDMVYNHEKIFIRICTNSEVDCVSYYLEGGKRYKLAWNTEKYKWDVFSFSM